MLWSTPLPGGDNGRLDGPAADRSVDDGDARGGAGVLQEQAGGDIVQGVQNQILTPDKRVCVVRRPKGLNGPEFDGGIDFTGPPGGGADLAGPQQRRDGQQLPVQVGRLEQVPVDCRDLPHAHPGQIFDELSPQAASARYQHPSAGKNGLLLLRDGGQVPGIALVHIYAPFFVIV